MKRLTETDKWRDSLFLGLSPHAKLCLYYSYDNCNEAGFIDYESKLFCAQLGMKLEEVKAALNELKPLLLSDKKKKLFIIDFLTHQKKLPLVRGREEDEWIIAKLESNLPKFDNAKEIQTILDKVVKEEVVEPVKKGSRKKEDKTFVVPNFEVFKEYWLTQQPEGELSDIQDLYDHYVSNGWKVGGRTPMKDYEAAIRKGIRSKEKYNSNTYRKPNNNNQSGEKKGRSETTFNVSSKFTSDAHEQ